MGREYSNDGEEINEQAFIMLFVFYLVTFIRSYQELEYQFN